MKIGIIGFGYVGQAIGWTYKDHDIIIRDPKLKNSAGLEKFTDRDAVFICVPSPSDSEGRCDSSILEQTIKDLLFATVANPDLVIICKTTAPPRVYSDLQQYFPNIVHSPEFLTAANNVADYTGSTYCVIGGHETWANRAKKVILDGVDIPDHRVVITDIKTAALYKYMMNCYLATKVTFMNDFKQLADTENVRWEDLQLLASHDNRIGTTHMDVPGPDGEYGWGGACFPKDVSAIIMEAIDQGLDFDLMQRVETLNKIHRKL